MESDIEFGDIEEARPDRSLRPDQNKHFAVVPVHQPNDEDLKIYVDLDVMKDMESHALSDTRVELGGVLLGGQYEDEDGVPFVWVTDSLRAEHYEATKGSFKFTHETWQQISRQREEFPEELQMVGWYHTHPDWGVFLSGMDLFICQNFFNRKLDLALVIDPCRGDRGWFQWRGNPDNPVRTGGYYLTASRFRSAEIEEFAILSEGKIPMSSDPRYSRVAGQIGPQPQYIPVPQAPARQPALELGVMGMLAMQMILIVLLAWQVLLPLRSEGEAKEAVVSELEAVTSELKDLRTDFDNRSAVQLGLMGELVDGGGSFPPTYLVDLKDRNKYLEAEYVASVASIAKKIDEISGLKDDLEEEENRTKFYKDLAASRNKKLEAANDEKDVLEDELTEAKEEAKNNYKWYKDWLYLVVLAGVAVLAGLGGMTLSTYVRRDDEDDLPPARDEPPIAEAMSFEPTPGPDNADESEGERS